MASINLSGVLLDPTGEFAVGDRIRFTHKSTTGETVQSAVSELIIGPTGAYNIDLEFGLVLVEYNDFRRRQYKNLGVATVNGTNPATSIPELLNALVPVSSAELIEFQAILADCVTAETNAAASAAAALVSENAAASSAASIDPDTLPIIFDTVSEYKNHAFLLTVGKVVKLLDRGAEFTVITGTGTANTFNIIASTSVNQSIDLTDETVIVEHWVDSSMTPTVRTEGIQAAIEYAINNLVDLKASSESLFAVNGTFLIPNQDVYGETVDLNFGGCTFESESDISLFSSAYYNASVLTSNIGTALESHNTFGTRLRGFIVKNTFGITNEPALVIQDWHQGAEIGEIFDKVSKTALRSLNNFYCKFGRIGTLTPSMTSGGRFIFEDAHNLTDIRHLQSTNAGFGYLFKGATSAAALRHMSFEGITIGLRTESTTFNLEVADSYCENITDTYFNLDGPIESFSLSNNYFNFVNNAGAFLLDYLPGTANNFIVEDSNTFVDFTDDMFFKTVSSTIGHNMGRITRRKRFAFDIDDFLTDNANFPKSTNVIQPLEQAGLKTHQVNNFAEGVYAGRFTSGRDAENGFEWIDGTSAIMNLRTKMVSSTSARIYVSLRISGGTLGFIRGELIGDTNVNGNMDFYEYTATGQEKTSTVTVSIVGGFFHLHYTHNATITAVVGEVRLT